MVEDVIWEWRVKQCRGHREGEEERADEHKWDLPLNRSAQAVSNISKESLTNLANWIKEEMQAKDVPMASIQHNWKKVERRDFIRGRERSS